VLAHPFGDLDKPLRCNWACIASARVGTGVAMTVTK